MEWSPQQEVALRLGRAWVKAVYNRAITAKKGRRILEVFGFAGTGKSTLVQALLAEENWGPEDVLYCAPTGKAAQVMRSKGCPGAMTLHRALYKVAQKGTCVLESLFADLAKAEAADPKEDQIIAQIQVLIDEEEARLRQLAFYVNPDAPANGARLIVVDEASMIGSRLGEDLMSLGKPVLVMGDPGQLPPVKDTAYFMQDTPDVMLTEVHRQALDSGILRLATDLRNGLGYRVRDYGSDCRVVLQGSPGNRELAVGADQVLVGRNATRHKANRDIRKARGREDPLPLAGDKLVCLQNNHDLDLMNGSQWRCRDPGTIRGSGIVGVVLDSLDGETQGLTVDVHAGYFQGREVSARGWRAAEHFDHGEAMTVHKSQGSQWPRVYVIDEARGDARHTYTAVTRAEKDLTLVAG